MVWTSLFSGQDNSIDIGAKAAFTVRGRKSYEHLLLSALLQRLVYLSHLSKFHSKLFQKKLQGTWKRKRLHTYLEALVRAKKTEEFQFGKLRQSFLCDWLSSTFSYTMQWGDNSFCIDDWFIFFAQVERIMIQTFQWINEWIALIHFTYTTLVHFK